MRSGTKACRFCGQPPKAYTCPLINKEGVPVVSRDVNPDLPVPLVSAVESTGSASVVQKKPKPILKPRIPAPKVPAPHLLPGSAAPLKKPRIPQLHELPSAKRARVDNSMEVDSEAPKLPRDIVDSSMEVDSEVPQPPEPIVPELSSVGPCRFPSFGRCLEPRCCPCKLRPPASVQCPGTIL